MRSLAAMAVAALALGGCARGLSGNEAALARTVFGPDFDTGSIRVSQGLGLAPPLRTVPRAARLVTGGEGACLRTPQPRPRRQPLAFALGERIHLTSEIWSSDAALGWPDALRYPHALTLVHELVHVWQYRNRALTGYAPVRAAAESLALADPYYAPPGASGFLDYGFEQQAAFVEDFLCFTAANPDHPRRAELRELLEPHFDVAAIEAALAPGQPR